MLYIIKEIILFIYSKKLYYIWSTEIVYQSLEYIVDIYVKIVIAVFGFIAPSVTLLMPIFSSKISDTKKRIVEQKEVTNTIKNQLRNEYTKSIEALKDNTLKNELEKTIDTYLKSRTKKFEDDIKDLEGDLKSLNLKIRIRDIFGLLILTLLFIMIAHLLTPKFDYKNFTYDDKIFIISIILQIISISLFIWALSKIWKSVCIVVEHNITNDVTSDGIGSFSKNSEEEVLNNINNDNIVS